MERAFQELVPQSVASTSSSSKKPCYEVFINHHGKDVKYKLASCIYNMLDLMRVQVFLDKEELKVGDSFPPAIEEAMRSASVHIALFSPSYAESPWCLDELALMLKIKVEIIPVFYGVDPCDLRYAKRKYAVALDEHRSKGRYSLEKIEEWRDALSRVSYLNGCMLDANKDDEKGLTMLAHHRYPVDMCRHFKRTNFEVLQTILSNSMESEAEGSFQEKGTEAGNDPQVLSSTKKETRKNDMQKSSQHSSSDKKDNGGRKGGKKAALKTTLGESLGYGPTLLEHIILDVGLQSNMKIDNNNLEMINNERLQALAAAITRFEDWLEEVIRGTIVPEGYIIMHKNIPGKK